MHFPIWNWHILSVCTWCLQVYTYNLKLFPNVPCLRGAILGHLGNHIRSCDQGIIPAMSFRHCYMLKNMDNWIHRNALSLTLWRQRSIFILIDQTLGDGFDLCAPLMSYCMLATKLNFWITLILAAVLTTLILLLAEFAVSRTRTVIFCNTVGLTVCKPRTPSLNTLLQLKTKFVLFNDGSRAHLFSYH